MKLEISLEENKDYVLSPKKPSDKDINKKEKKISKNNLNENNNNQNLNTNTDSNNKKVENNLKKINYLNSDDENENNLINRNKNNKGSKNHEKNDLIENFDIKIKEKPLLIILNKQDLKEKISNETIAKNLGLYKLKQINWQIKETSCITGEGIFECMDWVFENMKIKEELKSNDNQLIKKSK